MTYRLLHEDMQTINCLSQVTRDLSVVDGDGGRSRLQYVERFRKILRFSQVISLKTLIKVAMFKHK